MKSLLKDVSSHRQVVDKTVNKLQTLTDAAVFSDQMSSTKNRYENLLTATQVKLYKTANMLQFTIINSSHKLTY